MTLAMATRAPTGATVGTLAVREASRMLRHPVYVVFLIYFVVLAAAQAASAGLASREAIREILVSLGILWLGPATFLAANLIASSARRSHAETQLAAAPTSQQARTLATCFGVLGPTAFATGFAAILWLVDRAPGPAELAAIPLCTLGGGLLAVAVAHWLPWRGAPLIVMFALIAWVVAVLGRGDLQWMAPWTVSQRYFDEFTDASGSHAWHAVYLLGLSLLAAVAALLRYPSFRRPLLTLGALLWVGTLVAGWAQLR